MSQIPDSSDVAGIAHPSQPSHVVAIGASAGGLEALQKLFHAMPTDLGAAFLVVQHLSPDFKSMMDELLSRHTSMETRVASDGEALGADCIYLIPPGKLMTVAEGKIWLAPLSPEVRVNLPINELFRSVAADFQNRAIGIVLSGTGSDGSRGILALKEVGAMVLAQDPEEAQFDGMLVNAINTGSVDFVLRVADMAEHIRAFITHLLAKSPAELFSRHLADNEQILAEILRIVARETGLDFSQYKQSTVARRIEHRMSINRLTVLADYLAFLQANPDEARLVQQDLLIGVTQFFRDEAVWKSLQTNVIRELVAAAPEGDQIRVWCAGCATGEEAYTLAMLVDDELRRQKKRARLKVFGSDVDASAVNFAANGVYPAGIVNEIPPAFLSTYFRELPDGSYQVGRELRQMVVFATHNMIEDPPFSNVDLVSCRNTLIYLQSEAQKKALAFLHFALRKGCYLLLGTAESLGSFSDYFEVFDARLRIFRKNSDLRIPVLQMSKASRITVAMSRAQASNHALPLRAADTHAQVRASRQVGSDALLAQFAPPSLIVDDKMRIVHTYGDTAPFLSKPKPGALSTNLADLLVDDLVGTVTSAVQQARSRAEPVRIEGGFNLPEDTRDQQWSLLACRFHDSATHKEFVALSFLDGRARPGSDNAQLLPLDEHVRELNRALIHAQNDYRTVVEELDTTSEELQASNEELMAANEELQSTNEELQSVNQELYTVNSEHQEKIAELMEANDDLTNLLRASHLAVLFLTPDLRIRRFTSSIREFISLLEVDIGRPFADLSFRFPAGPLTAAIIKANETGQGSYMTLAAEKDAGDIVEVSVAPYNLPADQTANGVIVSMRRPNMEIGGPS